MVENTNESFDVIDVNIKLLLTHFGPVSETRIKFSAELKLHLEFKFSTKTQFSPGVNLISVP